MTYSKLLESYNLAGITLQNRMVMAPLTRSRAIGNVPNDLMRTYYGQRAGAGLIITEGTSPSPNGLGYPRIPGIFNEAQRDGWKDITSEVHDKDGHIFVQLMHVGRVAHPANLPEGAEIVAPSTVPVSGQMYTDAEGLQDYPAARLMNEEDILKAQDEYVHASRLAIEAGFDGVELHGANGYLIEQFLNKNVNELENSYGGSDENRVRFLSETAKKVADAIGASKVGLRVSPYGVFNDTGAFDTIEETYKLVAEAMSDIGIAYIHIVDHSAMGAPEVPDSIKAILNNYFTGAIILSGGYDAARAEADLEAEKGDLVAFGRPFIANPDLVTRYKENAEVAVPDHNTFYTPGPEGYTDYPFHTEA